MAPRRAIHAIILAGGAGSRLAASAPHGVPSKPLLRDADGHRLIDQVLSACSRCTTRVVVAGPMDLPAGVIRVREEPPLGGPAAAIRAGAQALMDAGYSDDDAVLLLAADLVNPAQAISTLVELRPVNNSGNGYIGSAHGQLQPLLSLLRLGALYEATSGDLRNCSVRHIFDLIGWDTLATVELSTSTTIDIDTWGDALAYGYGQQHSE